MKLTTNSKLQAQAVLDSAMIVGARELQSGRPPMVARLYAAAMLRPVLVEQHGMK